MLVINRIVEKGSVRNWFDSNLVEFEAEMVVQWCGCSVTSKMAFSPYRPR